MQHNNYFKKTTGPIRIRIILCAIFVFSITAFLPISAEARTDVLSSSLIEDTVWSPNDGPYVINGEVVVGNNATLTILPGTVIQLGLHAKLTARNGHITAKGTADQHIAFADDLGGAGDGGGVPSQNPGYWSGIYISTNGSADLAYVTIRNAFAGVRIDNGAIVTIDHATVSDCKYGTLTVGSSLVVTNSTFTRAQPRVDMETLFTHSGNYFPDDDKDGWIIGGNTAYTNIDISNADGSYTLSPIFSIMPSYAMTIHEGVTIRLADLDLGPRIRGTLTFAGTAEHPIIVRGTGGCPLHAPAFNLDGGTVHISHTIFKDMCGGFSGQAAEFSVDAATDMGGIAMPANAAISQPAVPPAVLPVDNAHAATAVEAGVSPATTVTVSSPKRIPVLIVPGIAGTRLLKGYGDRSEVWPNIAGMALSLFDKSLDALGLRDDGTPYPDTPIVTGDIMRSVSVAGLGEVADTFAGLISDLTAQGYKENVDLFVSPYDWRLSVSAAAPLLNDKIAAITAATGSTSVAIVAHSMGGLVVKSYEQQYGTASLAKVIFVGTPQWGAPLAAKTLLFGDDLGARMGISIVNQETIRRIVQHMPSMYELLPTDAYVARFGAYLGEQAAALLQGGRGVHLSAAHVVHGLIDAIHAQVPTYSIVACSAPTLSHIESSGWLHGMTGGLLDAFGMRLQYDMRGDGTVPIASAIAGGLDNVGTVYYSAIGTHSALPSVGDVKTAISALLVGKNPPHTNVFSDNDLVCTGNTHGGVEISTIGLNVSVTKNSTMGSSNTQGAALPAYQESVGNQSFAFLPNDASYDIAYAVEATGIAPLIVTDAVDASGSILATKQFAVPMLPVGTQLSSSVSVGDAAGVPSNTVIVQKTGETILAGGGDAAVENVPVQNVPIQNVLPADASILTPTERGARAAGSVGAMQVTGGMLNLKNTKNVAITASIAKSTSHFNVKAVQKKHAARHAKHARIVGGKHSTAIAQPLAASADPAFKEISQEKSTWQRLLAFIISALHHCVAILYRWV